MFYAHTFACICFNLCICTCEVWCLTAQQIKWKHICTFQSVQCSHSTSLPPPLQSIHNIPPLGTSTVLFLINLHPPLTKLCVTVDALSGVENDSFERHKKAFLRNSNISPLLYRMPTRHYRHFKQFRFSKQVWK